MAAKILRTLSIQGLILIPLRCGASFLGSLPFSSFDFCIPLLFIKWLKRHPCWSHTPVASNIWVTPQAYTQCYKKTNSCVIHWEPLRTEMRLCPKVSNRKQKNKLLFSLKCFAILISIDFYPDLWLLIKLTNIIHYLPTIKSIITKHDNNSYLNIWIYMYCNNIDHKKSNSSLIYGWRINVIQHSFTHNLTKNSITLHDQQFVLKYHLDSLYM